MVSGGGDGSANKASWVGLVAAAAMTVVARPETVWPRPRPRGARPRPRPRPRSRPSLALALASGAVAIMAVGRWASLAAADVMCPMDLLRMWISLEIGTISGGGGSGGNGCTDSLGCRLSDDCSAPIVLGRIGCSLAARQVLPSRPRRGHAARAVCVCGFFGELRPATSSVQAVVSSKRHSLPTATLRDLCDPDSQLAVIAAHNTSRGAAAVPLEFGLGGGGDLPRTHTLSLHPSSWPSS